MTLRTCTERREKPRYLEWRPTARWVRLMKTIHTVLRQDPDHLTQNLVRSELLSQRGVSKVSFDPNCNRISVEYDPAIIDDFTLMLVMRLYGVCPAPTSQGPGAQHGDG
jgi:hypothetical protein